MDIYDNHYGQDTIMRVIFTGGVWSDTGIGNYTEVLTDGWFEPAAPPVVVTRVPWAPRIPTRAKRRHLYIRGVRRI